MMVPTMMCLGVDTMLVPLLDLGSVQVLKACKFESNVEVYHLDECHHHEDGDKLRKRFQSVHDEERENVTILFFFMSPQGLSKDSM